MRGVVVRRPSCDCMIFQTTRLRVMRAMSHPVKKMKMTKKKLLLSQVLMFLKMVRSQQFYVPRLLTDSWQSSVWDRRCRLYFSAKLIVDPPSCGWENTRTHTDLTAIFRVSLGLSGFSLDFQSPLIPVLSIIKVWAKTLNSSTRLPVCLVQSFFINTHHLTQSASSCSCSHVQTTVICHQADSRQPRWFSELTIFLSFFQIQTTHASKLISFRSNFPSCSTFIGQVFVLIHWPTLCFTFIGQVDLHWPSLCFNSLANSLLHLHWPSMLHLHWPSLCSTFIGRVFASPSLAKSTFIGQKVFAPPSLAKSTFIGQKVFAPPSLAKSLLDLHWPSRPSLAKSLLDLHWPSLTATNQTNSYTTCFSFNRNRGWLGK